MEILDVVDDSGKPTGQAFGKLCLLPLHFLTVSAVNAQTC